MSRAVDFLPVVCAIVLAVYRTRVQAIKADCGTCMIGTASCVWKSGGRGLHKQARAEHCPGRRLMCLNVDMRWIVVGSHNRWHLPIFSFPSLLRVEVQVCADPSLPSILPPCRWNVDGHYVMGSRPWHSCASPPSHVRDGSPSSRNSDGTFLGCRCLSPPSSSLTLDSSLCLGRGGLMRLNPGDHQRRSGPDSSLV